MPSATPTPAYRRLAFIVLLIATFIAAIVPSAEAPTLGASDKVNHIAAFITLSIAAAWAWPKQRLAVIASAMIVFGGLIELAQAIPAIGRDAEWADWGADAAAVTITLAVVAVIRLAMRRQGG